jgi:ferredoxin
VGAITSSTMSCTLPVRGRGPVLVPFVTAEWEGTMGFKVVVDFDKCESNALCMGVAPEVFEVRDDDFLYVLQEEPPDELKERCEEAARVCPKQAITIQDL